MARWAWYRQPVLWLGVAIFLASIAGCIEMIVLGARLADEPLATSPTILGVPTAPSSTPSPSP